MYWGNSDVQPVATLILTIPSNHGQNWMHDVNVTLVREHDIITTCTAYVPIWCWPISYNLLWLVVVPNSHAIKGFCYYKWLPVCCWLTHQDLQSNMESRFNCSICHSFASLDYASVVRHIGSLQALHVQVLIDWRFSHEKPCKYHCEFYPLDVTKL